MRGFWRLPSASRVRLFVMIYITLAALTGLEAISQQPHLANLAGAIMSLTLAGERVHELPGWADDTRVYLTDKLSDGVLGLTAGTTIFIDSHSRHDHSLLLHEVMHARQYQRHTTLGFSAVYLWHAVALLIRYPDQPQLAYYLHPFELEAYRAQFSFWDTNHARATASNY